jgi:hypothetical protein
MKHKCAIFTIVQDEAVRLPVWLRHYQQTGCPLYVLDHESGTEQGAAMQTAIDEAGAMRVPIFRDQSFCHVWLRDTAAAFQRFLLQSYEYVLFVEVDEIVTTRPGGRYADLKTYIQAFNMVAICCDGYEVVQQLDEEPDLDFEQLPLLQQRSMWYRSHLYSKPLLSSVPLTWTVGFHQAEEIAAHMAGMVDPDLLLLHLHKIDFAQAVQRNTETARSRVWSDAKVDQTAGFQNRLTDEAALREFWTSHVDTPLDTNSTQPLEQMPDAIRNVI